MQWEKLCPVMDLMSLVQGQRGDVLVIITLSDNYLLK